MGLKLLRLVKLFLELLFLVLSQKDLSFKIAMIYGNKTIFFYQKVQPFIVYISIELQDTFILSIH